MTDLTKKVSDLFRSDVGYKAGLTDRIREVFTDVADELNTLSLVPASINEEFLSINEQSFSPQEKLQLQANIGLGDDDVPDFRVIFENGLV